jgi:tellurite resistance protein
MRVLSAEVQERIKKATAAVPVQAALRSVRTSDDPPIPPGPRDAIVEACFLMAAVDGHVGALELAQLAEAFDQMFGAAAGVDMDELVRKLADRLATDGWERRMYDASEALGGTELAETAFRLIAAVAFVDDSIAIAESAALDAFGAALELTRERVHELLSEVREDLFGKA